MKQSIKVMLRVRPLIAREKSTGHTNSRLTLPSQTQVDIKDTGSKSSKSFSFHNIFTPEASQAEVYQTFAKDAVDAIFEGYHGVLLVYGQTASGKTYHNMR